MKKTKSEESVDLLDDLIDPSNMKKETKKAGKTKADTISFQVNRSLLSSALGLIDQLTGLSTVSKSHITLDKKKIIIRATGVRRAVAIFNLETIVENKFSIQPELKTLLELIKKFNSRVLTISINTKNYQISIKDKNISTKLICNSAEEDISEVLEDNLEEPILSLEGNNLEVFSKANLDSKMTATASSNFSRIVVYPKSNTLSYYITNGVLLNAIEADRQKGTPIILNIENSELSTVLRSMNGVKEYTSVQIKTLKDSEQKFVDIVSKELRIIYNISEVDCQIELQKLMQSQEEESTDSLSFVFLPYKFLDFIKTAAPIIKNEAIEELIMVIDVSGQVEMKITGFSGNVIRSKYNIEKLSNFPPNQKQLKIHLACSHFSIILGHYASKPAYFHCIGDLTPKGHKVVFIKSKEEDSFVSYKSLLTVMDEVDISEESTPF